MPSPGALDVMCREIARGARLIDLCNERKSYTPAEFFRDLGKSPELKAKYELALRCRCEVELETATARLDRMLDGTEAISGPRVKVATVALMQARWLAERLLPERFAVQRKHAGVKGSEADQGDVEMGKALEAAMKRIEARKIAATRAAPPTLRAVPGPGARVAPTPVRDA